MNEQNIERIVRASASCGFEKGIEAATMIIKNVTRNVPDKGTQYVAKVLLDAIAHMSKEAHKEFLEHLQFRVTVDGDVTKQ